MLQKVFQQIVWLQLLVHKIEPSSCSRTHLLVTMKGVITRNDDSILNCKKTTMTLLLYSYATNFLQYEMTCEFRPPHCNSCSVKQYPYQKYSRLRCLLRVTGLLICFYLGWSGSTLLITKHVIKVGSKS